MAKFCTNCGAEISNGYAFCEQCGTPVDERGKSQGKSAQPAGTPINVYNNTVVQQPKKGNGMAVAGFITSLVNALLCCGSISLISLILSIIGAVKAKDCDGAGKGLAIAGIVISAIMMVVGVIVWLVYGIAWLAAMEEGYY